jgi:hypothetical protein
MHTGTEKQTPRITPGKHRYHPGKHRYNPRMKAQYLPQCFPDPRLCPRADYHIMLEASPRGTPEGKRPH